MNNRLVLVSDDSDFFDFFIKKLRLRKSDELFQYSYDDLIQKIDMLGPAVIVLNGEVGLDKTLEMLSLLQNFVCIVFSYNNEQHFRVKAFEKGAFASLNIMIDDSELKSIVSSAFRVASLIKKKNFYKDFLIENNIISGQNEVFTNYIKMLEKELKLFNSGSGSAVLVAISPNEKSKFLLKPNQIETFLLAGIRNDDLLLNYAPNKYFLILHNTDVKSAQKIWLGIKSNIKEKIYAGFAQFASYKNRQQLVDEALTRLHEAINADKNYISLDDGLNVENVNFKNFRKEFAKKIDLIIVPTFYHIQEKYRDKLSGVVITQGSGDGYSCLYIKNNYKEAVFKITAPGFSKINIDLSIKIHSAQKDFKRISLEPEEFNSELLENLLEQFIIEYKKENYNDDVK